MTTERYTIRKSVVIEAPAGSVFPLVATQEGLRTWFNPNITFAPEVGAKVVHHSQGAELSGEVVTFEPGKRLAFTWNQTPPGYPTPTLLTIELAEEQGDTRVHISHSGFEHLPESVRDDHFAGYSFGWNDDGMLSDLKALAEGRQPEDTVVTSHAVYGPNGPQTMEIRMQLLIHARKETVWKAVASQEGLRHWLNSNMEFEPRVGGAARLIGSHGGTPYIFGGQVEEFAPPDRLSFAWDAENTPFPVKSLLTIQLAEEAGGTRVHLTHHGFERLPALAQERFLDFREGWDGSDLMQLKKWCE